LTPKKIRKTEPCPDCGGQCTSGGCTRGGPKYAKPVDDDESKDKEYGQEEKRTAK